MYICIVLWSQILYGNRVVSILPKYRTILRHPYGARPATGTYDKKTMIRHCTVPGEV